MKKLGAYFADGAIVLFIYVFLPLVLLGAVGGLLFSLWIEVGGAIFLWFLGAIAAVFTICGVGFAVNVFEERSKKRKELENANHPVETG